MRKWKQLLNNAKHFSERYFPEKFIKKILKTDEQ